MLFFFYSYDNFHYGFVPNFWWADICDQDVCDPDVCDLDVCDHLFVTKTFVTRTFVTILRMDVCDQELKF